VFTDCSSLEGIFRKPLGDIKNRWIRDLVEKLMCYTFKFRKTFKEKLKLLGFKHRYSSAYHPQSNSLAERAVGSVKNSLKKSPTKITDLYLKEIIFGMNSTTSQEGTRMPMIDSWGGAFGLFYLIHMTQIWTQET